MADFKSWALQYVLADEDASRVDATIRTAEAIKSASARSTAVLGWVQSIDPWMPAATHQGGSTQAADAGGESEFNVIARAKALDFLADTLSLLDKALLRTDQVNLLVVFFGRLFSVDHKAGITAASKALSQLATMKGFKPEMGEVIIQSVASMRDDFRLQPPLTRLEIYTLVHTLIANGMVASQLQHTYGSAGGFALDLVQLSRHERDPSCLLRWFSALQSLIGNFSFSAGVDEELFKSFSAYFPISMRSSVNPAGITVDDLKLSVRACFSASERLARLTLPFLIQKLDQGDAVTVPVKVDILKTLSSCLEQYRNPSLSIAPFTSQVWNSLKYEVRNGEVREIIDSTLTVMRTLSMRLATVPLAPSATPSQGQEQLGALTAMVLDDCLEDLANPSYTKSAGLLLESVLGVHTRPFALMLPRILGAITANLREPRTPAHAKACLGILTSLLHARSRLVQTTANAGPLEVLQELDPLVLENAHATFTRFWRENNIENPDAGSVAVLQEVTRGLAALVCQPGYLKTGDTSLLCGDQQCDQICAAISDRIVNIFRLASSPDAGPRKELADAAVVSLRQIVCAYPRGYSAVLERAVSSVRDRHWGDTPSRNSLDMLKTLLLRLSYIGCSDLPTLGPPLQHLRLFAISMLQLTYSFLDRRVPFEVPTLAVSGLYNALIHFRDACVSRGLHEKRGLVSAEWKSLGAGGSPPLVGLNPTPTGQGTVPDRATIADTYREYLECSLGHVAGLYRRAATVAAEPVSGQRLSPDFDIDVASPGTIARLTDLQDLYLHQLADMATFVIRDLKEEEQQLLQLPGQIFGLFSTGTLPSASVWLSPHDSGRTNVLSLGILRGLRTGALAHTVASNELANSILEDVKTAGDFPERTQKVRDRVLMVLVNKWIPKPAANDPQRQVWKATIASLELLVQESNGGMTMASYSRILAALAGAIARRDKDIGSLATLVSALPASLGDDGEWMARCLEDLVSSKDQLDPENHAVARPLSQQWVYVQVVSPKLESSFPIAQNKPGGVVQAISAARLLRHMDFYIYEGDVSNIVRMAIAGATSFSNHGDVEAALSVLRRILKHKPDALKDQIKAVIAGAVKVLRCGLDASPSADGPSKIPARFRRQGSSARCRIQVLLLLKDIAQSLEKGLLGHYSANMSRILGDACGDPVREVRQSALAARQSWGKVAQR